MRRTKRNTKGGGGNIRAKALDLQTPCQNSNSTTPPTSNTGAKPKQAPHGANKQKGTNGDQNPSKSTCIPPAKPHEGHPTPPLHSQHSKSVGGDLGTKNNMPTKITPEPSPLKRQRTKGATTSEGSKGGKGKRKGAKERKSKGGEPSNVIGHGKRETKIGRARIYEDDTVTAMQYIFAQEYIRDMNAGQAAIRAGYNPKNAAVIGAKLLKKKHVIGAIQSAIKQRIARTQVTADRVIQELGRVAFADPGAFFEGNGDVKNLSTMTKDQRHAIESVEVNVMRNREGDEVGFNKKIRFHNKMTALQTLGKHLGLLNERVELNVSHAHEHKIDVTNLRDDEIEILLKLVGTTYKSEDEILCLPE